MCFTREEPPTSARPVPFKIPSPTEWLQDNDPPGIAHLISSSMEYDVVLNGPWSLDTPRRTASAATAAVVWLAVTTTRRWCAGRS